MTTPVILNQTSATNFVVDIPDNDYTKELKLSIQGVTLPMMNIPVTDVALNPMLRGKIPGSQFEFDPLVIRMVVDENLQSYFGVYRWMIGTVDYMNASSVRWLESDQTLSVHILDNSQLKTIATMHFYGAWPSNLGELDMLYSNDTDEPVTCMVTFNFKYMEIEYGTQILTPIHKKSN
ncbi:tail tube protein [Pectobacterium phage POP12]|nr:tail tube protein [Pectobacterium phage POP12]